jgi:hypothetical protein
MDKIDEIVDKVVKSFEEHPVKSTIKAVIVLYVLKEVARWWKN